MFFSRAAVFLLGDRSFSRAEMNIIIPRVTLLAAAASVCLGGESGCGVGGGDVYLTELPHPAHKGISSVRFFRVRASISTPSGLFYRQFVGTTTGNIMINYSRKLRKVEVVVTNI